MLSAYSLGAVIALYFLVRRRDCFSCSIRAAIVRSLLFAAIVTPTIVPHWVLIPEPASVAFLSAIWAFLFISDFSGVVFVQFTIVFVFLPILLTTTLTFLVWLWLRRRRQRQISRANGLQPNA